MRYFGVFYEGVVMSCPKISRLLLKPLWRQRSANTTAVPAVKWLSTEDAVTGLAMACAFGQSSRLSDRKIIHQEGSQNKSWHLPEEYNNHVCVLNGQKIALFKKIGAWDHITNMRSQPKTKMQDYCVSLGDENIISKNSERTMWFDYPNGDANIPEICYLLVESLCGYESSGCDQLHSSQHFHWQIIEQGDSWYNLTLSHIKCLELSYCNPGDEAVTRLNPVNLDSSSRDRVLRLMGHAEWKADFNTMTISCLSQWKVLKLRHNIDGNIFSWYFKDKNKKWIEYGKVDSTGKLHLKSNYPFIDIKKVFKANPEKSLSYCNLNFKYPLVRGQPMPYLSKNEDGQNKSTKTSKTILPSSWESMELGERVQMFNLDPSSSEYQAAMIMFQGNYNVTEIKRIQNPFHYRAFENKVQDLTAVFNNDLSKVDVRQLFHGTKSSVIKSICSENFDWRLHGTGNGSAYGKGTYFSPDVNLSYGYCPPDPSSGSKCIFIARVAVGSMILGDSSMSRPPINPQTSMPYDSTVNNMLSPTIIVKYDKQEYYPEYIVTLK